MQSDITSVSEATGGPQDMRVTENITFSGKVVWSIVVAVFLLAGTFYDSKRVSASLQRDVLELQRKYDAEIIAIRSDQKQFATESLKRSGDFTVAIRQLSETMDRILEEQRIQTELTRLRAYDRWTAGMEEDQQTQWLDFILKYHPEAELSDLPHAREIQREHLRESWNRPE